MIKEKQCIGLDIAFGFPGCSKIIKVEHRKFGLCKECLKKWITTTESGQSYMNRAMRITKKDHEKENPIIKPFDKKQHKKDKEALKTLSDYEKEAKVIFQKWVRLRDAGQNCISCDKPVKDPAGGHFYGAGTYSGLMFNPDNCHLQCNAHCNKFLSGNLLEYRKGLINRYGIEFVENLDNLSIQLRNYKYTKIELQEIKQKYVLKIKNNDFKN